MQSCTAKFERTPLKHRNAHTPSSTSSHFVGSQRLLTLIAETERDRWRGNGVGLRGKKSLEQTARRRQPGEPRMYAVGRFEERGDEQRARREARILVFGDFRWRESLKLWGFRRWREPTWRPRSRPFGDEWRSGGWMTWTWFYELPIFHYNGHTKSLAATGRLRESGWLGLVP